MAAMAFLLPPQLSHNSKGIHMAPGGKDTGGA